MVLEAFGQALLNFVDIEIWLFIILGVISGLVLGLIPGLSALVGLALFLPFVFFLPAEQGLPLMVAMQAIVFTGGALTAILINVPGTDPNAATMLDGFPMSQKGEAGRALGAAFGASGAGGIVVIFLALIMVPLIIPMVLAITSADLVFIILMGVSFIAVLGSGSMRKGIISGGLGLLISLVGFQMVTGVHRFTFGSVYLYDGIKLVPLALGLFAIPEVIDLAAKGGSIARVGTLTPKWQDVFEGIKDVFRYWKLWLRSSIIGYIIGIIPGVGGTVATFVSYGHAKATSKYPEKFGTGIVEGVIAPESANNASAGGALLTALALGIPGSAAGALLLAGFLMVGLVPGPEMMTSHLDLSLTLLLTIVIANLMGIAICLPLASRIARISTIPGRILVPLLAVVVLVAAFVIREQFLDVVVLLVFGMLGLGMKHFGYNRAALFLGFILGRLFEKYFFIALQTGGNLFFLRPISLVVIALTIGVIVLGPIKDALRRRKGAGQG